MHHLSPNKVNMSAQDVGIVLIVEDLIHIQRILGIHNFHGTGIKFGADVPYKIKGKTVINSSTGKVVGHSKNPKKYLRALYANVPHARSKRSVTRKLMKAYRG